MTPRDRLTAIWETAVRAVDAGDAVESALGAVPDRGRIFVLSVGKAAYAMAARVEALLAERIAGGLVVTKDGHAGELVRLETHEAGHPLPDSRSEEAARLALRRVAALQPDDVLPFRRDGDQRVAELAEMWLQKTGGADPVVRLTPPPGDIIFLAEGGPGLASLHEVLEQTTLLINLSLDLLQQTRAYH